MARAGWGTTGDSGPVGWEDLVGAVMVAAVRMVRQGDDRLDDTDEPCICPLPCTCTACVLYAAVERLDGRAVGGWVEAEG